MASYFTWRLLKNRVLKTQFIILYITKMKSEPEGKKKERKKKTTKKKPRKNQIHPGRASLAAWPASRCPGRVTQVVRPLIWSPSLRSGLPLSDLIWLFLPLWSDLIRWGEAALETQSFKKKFVYKSSLKDLILKWLIRPRKSSFKDTIYCPKLSLLDSNC